MTVVVASNPSADTINLSKGTKVEGFAAEAIPALSAVHIDSAGAIALSLGAAADAAGAIVGVVPRDAITGEPVTAYGVGTVYQWDSTGSLTPGQQLFLAVAGGIDDVATTGDVTGHFVAISTTDVMLIALQSIGGL